MRGEEKERNTERQSKSRMFCRQSDDGQTDKKIVREQVDEKTKTKLDRKPHRQIRGKMDGQTDWETLS